MTYQMYTTSHKAAEIFPFLQYYFLTNTTFLGKNVEFYSQYNDRVNQVELFCSCWIDTYMHHKTRYNTYSKTNYRKLWKYRISSNLFAYWKVPWIYHNEYYIFKPYIKVYDVSLLIQIFYFHKWLNTIFPFFIWRGKSRSKPY